MQCIQLVSIHDIKHHEILIWQFWLFSYRGLDKLPLRHWTNAALISGINHLTTDGLVLPLTQSMAYKYI